MAETAIESAQRSPGRARVHRILLVVASLVAFVAACAAALSPTIDRGSQVSWDSQKDPNPAAISYVDALVRSIEVTGFGGRAPEAEDSVLTTFHGPSDFELARGDNPRPRTVPTVSLTVRLNEGGVQADLASTSGEVLASTGPIDVGGGTGSFPTAWSVRFSDGRVEVVAGDKRVETAVPAGYSVAANWVELDGGPANWTVRMVSSGNSLDQPGGMHRWGIILALGIPFALLVWVGWSRRRARTAKAGVRFRLRWLDGLVIVGIVASAFIARANFDDGWILWRARMLVERPWGIGAPLTDPYQGGIAYVQGFLYESLFGATFAHSTLIVGIRGLTVLMAFAVWLLVSRRILPATFGNASDGLQWAAAACVLLWSLAWMMLRPEVPVMLVSAVLLAVGSRTRGRSTFVLITFVVALVGLGQSLHQSGLILIPAGLVLVAPLLWDRRRPIAEKIAGVLAGGALAMAFVFFTQNLEIARRFLAAYGGGQVLPFDEWTRFSDLMRLGTVSQRVWIYLGIAGLLALWGLIIWRLLNGWGMGQSSVVLLAAGLMPLGLLFTSSKWPWHYAALAMPVLLGVVAATRLLSRARSRRGFILVSAVAAVAWMTFALKDSEFYSEWTLLAALGMALLAGAGLSLGGYRIHNEQRIGLVLTSGFLVAFCVTLAGGLAVTLNAHGGWSPLAQSFGGLFSERLRCGMGEDIMVPPGSSQMNALDVVAKSRTYAVVPSDWVLQNPCVVPPTMDSGLWDPISYVYHDVSTGMEYLPMDEHPQAACMQHPVPAGADPFPFCFYEVLPPETPHLSGTVIDVPRGA